jgi:hypothetical protein
LTTAALRTPLADLVSFLEYAQDKLPKVHSTLSTTLTDPDNLETLTKTALRTPLHFLASFLEYAEGNLPETARGMDDRLRLPEAIKQLAQAACRSPLDSLVKFLDTTTTAKDVVAAIDLETWKIFRLSEKSYQPNAIVSFAKLANRMKRPELAEVLACRLINAGERKHWHAPGITMEQLTHTLRLGRAAGPREITRFLDQVITKQWVENQYNIASPGALAGALFSLWGY